VLRDIADQLAAVPVFLAPGLAQHGRTLQRVHDELSQPTSPTYEQVWQAWHGRSDPWGGCADLAAVERIMALLTPGDTGEGQHRGH
jgi:hypothetical protein